jgi:hypothetical protein
VRSYKIRSNGAIPVDGSLANFGALSNCLKEMARIAGIIIARKDKELFEAKSTIDKLEMENELLKKRILG